jgi:hypothetical protein
LIESVTEKLPNEDADKRAYLAQKMLQEEEDLSREELG